MSKVIQFPTHMRQAAIDAEYAELELNEEYVKECEKLLKLSSCM